MPNPLYVVDRKLGAVPLHQLLEVRESLRSSGKIDNDPHAGENRPVVSGGAKALVPDKLYSASNNQSLKFYLPRYRVAVDNEGCPAVELRYSGTEDNEAGRLTLTLSWQAPRFESPGREFEIQMMDHVANLALRYNIPLANGSTVAGGSVGGEEVVPLQPLQQVGGCKATSTTIIVDKAQFDAIYQAMRDPTRKAVLELTISSRVAVRTFAQVSVCKVTEKDQLKQLKNNNALRTNLVGSVPVRRAVLSNSLHFTRIPIPKPKPETTVNSSLMRAVLIHHARPGIVAHPEPVVGAATPAKPAAAVTRAAISPGVASALSRTMVRRGGVTPVAARRITGLRTLTAAARPAAARTTVARKRVVSERINAATLSRANRPKKLSAVIAVSDLKIKGRKMVPTELSLNDKQQPALVDADLQNEQQISFSFDPALSVNRAVFVDAGFHRGAPHLLFPMTIVDPNSGKSSVVYQDSLMPDVVYIAPTAFRLLRESMPPYLPAISFLPNDFATTEDDAEAEVLFRVAVVYRLEPWFDPDLIERARVEVERTGHIARFTPIVPRDAKLSLNLELLGDEQTRDEVTVDPATSISDVLELDHDAFVRLWREWLANPAVSRSGSGGIGGHVTYNLFEGSIVQSQVRISLWESSVDLFDVTYLGPVEGRLGGHRVAVRNRIESPAVISEVRWSPAEPEATAGVVNASEVIGAVLQPQEVREIDLNVSPPATVVEKIEPTVVGHPEPDFNALLKMLMAKPGYSALSFSVPVKALAGVFSPPAAGEEALTGLLVEFDDSTRVILSPGEEEAEITLVGRLIDQILGSADNQQRYFYRVTNLHPSGEGARTKWQEGQGEDTLIVSSAKVQLDDF